MATAEDQEEKRRAFPQEVDFIQLDPITQQHDLLITEIESAEGHLGTALR